MEPDRHVFDRTTADQSVRLGGWFCSCGARFHDLDGLIHHVDDVLDIEVEPFLPGHRSS